MSQKTLSKEGYCLAASHFKLLADSTRLRILDLLRKQGEVTVNQVAEYLCCSQPTASRQLSKLFDAHFIARRRDQNCVFYFIEDESVFVLCEAMCGRLESRESSESSSIYEPELDKPDHDK